MAGLARRFVDYSRSNRVGLYVLVVAMLTYLVNQLDVFSLIATNISMANQMHYGQRKCIVSNETTVDIVMRWNLSIGNQTIDDEAQEEFCNDNQYLCSESSSSEDDTSPCKWYYTGLGWEYQLLAGPVYIVVFSISGIPLGLAAELNNISRKVALGVCCIFWGFMTIFGGLCNEYWQIAITRMLLGVASAGCVPFCASIISDYFPQDRGASLGFFNWGVYVGYSFTFLMIIAEKQLGWRAVYFIAGSPAVALGLLIWLTVREPARSATSGSQSSTEKKNLTQSLRFSCRQFLDPVLVLLSLGGAIRNGAGFVWAFNIVQFFDQYHPGTNVEEWMSWIPLIFGSIGAFGGGYLSDVMSRDRGIRGRLIVLIVCCVVSAPFQAGTLYLPMPWAFVSHMPAYLIGEMWIGVCVAVVVDIVPTNLTASAVAIYFFVIQLIGGNINVIVTPLSDAIDFRSALLITFPGFYLIAAAIFTICLTVLTCRSRSGAMSGTAEDNRPWGLTQDNEQVTTTGEKTSEEELPTYEIEGYSNNGFPSTDSADENMQPSTGYESNYFASNENQADFTKL